MKIIQINNENVVTENQVNNNLVNKPSGTLFFATKQDANSYANLAKWGDGTVCYTKLLEVGVLQNGTWNWA